MQVFEQHWQDNKRVRSFHRQLDSVPRDYYIGIIEEFEPETFLDVGCGTGITYELFKEHACEVKYTGLDITPKFIEELQEKHPEANWDVGRAQDLPYADKSFDMVTCRALLEHLPDPELAIHEMNRVSKGPVVIIWHLVPKSRETMRFLPKQGVFNNTYSKRHIAGILKRADLEITDQFSQKHRSSKRSHFIWILNPRRR